MAEPILVATALRRSYTDRKPSRWRIGRGASTATPMARPALDDVSLELMAGEMLGVVGESGPASPRLRAASPLLERPDSGQVIFQGQDLTALKGSQLRAVRRRIQIVFQDPFSSLNPRLSVGSAIGEVLTVHRIVPSRDVESRIALLLDQVGLPARVAERYPQEFSGGQRQRVCIARALAVDPEILIADEAVSSLDVSIQAQILNLLLDLRDEFGLTMIFISHNLHIVRRLAARIVVMFGGRIVELIPPGVDLDSAQHPYTRALLAAAPSLGIGEVLERSEEEAELSTALPATGCPFRERCPLAFEPCETIDPPLLPVGTGGLVACHAVARGSTMEGALA